MTSYKISAKNLVSNITALNQVRPSKSVVPILESIMVRGGTMVTSDLERTLELPMNNGDAFAPNTMNFFISNVKGLLQWLKRSKDNEITIEWNTDEQGLGEFYFIDGKRKVSFECEEKLENFPKLPSFDFEPETVVLKAEELVKLELAARSTSKDEEKAALFGVCLDNDTIVATNAHLLTQFNLERGNIFPEWRPIVPQNACKLINQLGLVKFEIGGNHMIASNDKGIKLYTRLIDQKFPDWKCVMPDAKDCNKGFTMNVGEFFNGLDDALSFCQGNYQAARLSLNGSVKVEGINPDFKESAEVEFNVKTTVKEGEFVIGFNGVLLKQIISNTYPGMTTAQIKKQDFSIMCWKKNHAVRINEHHILMPVMLEEEYA